MKNYLAYKEEIRGYGEVSGAIKTVEKIAASSLGRLRAELAALDSYQSAVAGALARLELFFQAEPRAKKDPKATAKRALVIVTGDRGLTGGLWRRVIDEFLGEAGKGYDVVIPIGSKGEKYLKEEKVNIEILQEEGVAAFRPIVDGFHRGSFSTVDILYPKFITLLEHAPVIVPFLPFMPPQNAAPFGLPIFEPAGSKDAIFAALMEKYVDSYFKKVLAEGKLSEFSARTLSMEHAGYKADELIKGLTLTYRKERRRLLTQKQLESFIVHKSP
jgi:F-type H+-transporting ATPase subunit gamma